MRLQLTSAVLLAVLLGAVTSVGCGKKAKPSDGEVAEAPPPPVVPLTTTPARPAVTTPVAVLPAPVQLPIVPHVVVPTAPAPPPKVEPEPPAVPPPAAPPVAQPPAPLGVPPITQPAKEPPKEAAKPKDADWPKEMYGRDLMAYLKDCIDPDPAMREMGLRTLPNFGPAARKAIDKDGKNLYAKTILNRMNVSNEKDTGVRTAAFAAAAAMGFEDEADTREAVRILGHAADNGVPGGQSRQHAVQALSAFGTKAEAAVAVLVGGPCVDTAYETRRSVAYTLGKIAFSETTGPSAKALTCLTTTLANDPSAVVRLEAMQSLALLGPPWEGTMTPGDKTPPRLDLRGVAAHTTALKKRLAPAPPGKGEKSSSGLVERDKQVELWVRVVLMRFDAKEMTHDEHLNAIARTITSGEQGPRIQALAIIGMTGEFGAKKLADITKVLTIDDLVVVQSAIGALVTLGVHAKPALPELRKLMTHKDADTKRMATEAVKYISEAKTPAEMPAAPPPKKP